MIICHEYEYIFLKTSKTAGTSIEIALSKHCGPRDVITPISPEDEQARADLGYRGAQNFHLPVTEYRARDFGRLVTLQPRGFYNHMSAAEVQALVAPDVWNRYFKFCFVRNPWDRVVSMYYWRTRDKRKRPPLSKYLASRDMRRLQRRGIGIYTIDGEVVVDRVCRYEQILDELEAIRERVGIPETLELPHAKSGARKDRRHYSQTFDDETREKVAELFADEIGRFGYACEAPPDGADAG